MSAPVRRIDVTEGRSKSVLFFCQSKCHPCTGAVLSWAMAWGMVKGAARESISLNLCFTRRLGADACPRIALPVRFDGSGI